MERSEEDRRRDRRVSLEAPLRIRRLSASASEPFTEQVIGNISLAGVYFETEQAEAYKINDVVIASVSVPETQRRAFPFTRVAGRSRVVRIRELPQASAAGRGRFGVALEFSNDITALTTIPPRA